MVSYTNPDIVSIFEQGDKFEMDKVLNDEVINVTYGVRYKPLYLTYSKQWKIRCFTQSLNKHLKLIPNFNLNEDVYVHINNINKFRFKEEHVRFFETRLSQQKLK